MTNEERKPIVKELLAKGQTLSQIQDTLRNEKGDSITYMELRLLLSEMPDAKLPEKELLKPVLPTAADADAGLTPKFTPKNSGNCGGSGAERRETFDQYRSNTVAGCDAQRLCPVLLGREGTLVPG